jgi:hypothetical protein
MAYAFDVSSNASRDRQETAEPLWSAVTGLLQQSNSTSTDKIVTQLESFRFTPGQIPLSTPWEVLAGIATYYAVVLSLQYLFANRKPVRCNPVFAVYNAVLSAFSLVLLGLILEQALPVLWHRGFFDSICAESSWTSRLETLYYVRSAEPTLIYAHSCATIDWCRDRLITWSNTSSCSTLFSSLSRRSP